MLARRRQPAPATAQAGTIPAPVGGINAVSPVTSMPEGDCVYAYNVIAGEGGIRTRPGWEAFSRADDLSVVVPDYRTLIPYKGGLADGSKDRLFVCFTNNLCDATPAGSGEHTGILDIGTGDLSGLGTWASTTGVDGARYLFYCDEETGLFRYDEDPETWQAIPQGATAGVDMDSDPPGDPGADPAGFVFCLPWKNRLWFVQKDSTVAWYTAGAGAISGTVTAFDFGRHFKNGGHLVGLWSWTYDGGAGLDDSLVAISSSGDVVIYQGTDPDDANAFGLKGVWSVGEVPKGRRIAYSTDGDVWILSFRGVIPLSRLVQGRIRDEDLETYKIQPLFNRFAQDYRDELGWSIHLHPTENAMLVLIPSDGLDGEKDVLAKSLSSGGWFQWRGMSLLCCAPWKGDLYMATDKGMVAINRGDIDYDYTAPEGVTVIGTPNQPISYSFLTRYENLGNARKKRVHAIRPTVLPGSGSPTVECRARFRAETTESVGAISSVSSTQPVFGASGQGREVAIELRGEATSRTTIAGIDVVFTQGGVL